MCAGRLERPRQARGRACSGAIAAGCCPKVVTSIHTAAHSPPVILPRAPFGDCPALAGGISRAGVRMCDGELRRPDAPPVALQVPPPHTPWCMAVALRALMRELLPTLGQPATMMRLRSLLGRSWRSHESAARSTCAQARYTGPYESCAAVLMMTSNGPAMQSGNGAAKGVNGGVRAGPPSPSPKHTNREHPFIAATLHLLAAMQGSEPAAAPTCLQAVHDRLRRTQPLACAGTCSDMPGRGRRIPGLLDDHWLCMGWSSSPGLASSDTRPACRRPCTRRQCAGCSA